MIQLTLQQVDLNRLEKIAQQIVRLYPTELVVGLVGTLGAGKTTFVQALAAAMGVDRSDVTSPTFTLLTSYEARAGGATMTLHHLDAYRLADEDEFLELGVEEFFEQPNTWTLIEWADRVRDVLPPETLWITIGWQKQNSSSGDCMRTMTLETQRSDLAGAMGELESVMTQ